jgi:hypothetical protein
VLCTQAQEVGRRNKKKKKFAGAFTIAPALTETGGGQPHRFFTVCWFKEKTP